MEIFLKLFFLSCLLTVNSIVIAADPNILSDEQIDKRIQQYRTAEVSLIITDSNGKPLANVPVTIRQTRHKFFFGCAAFDIDPNQETEYNHRFAAVFNYTTLPFYWGLYEKMQGQPDFEHLMAQAKWCRRNNITPKGHPLCWQQGEPAWLKDKSLEEVHSLLMNRVKREAGSFAGAIDVWDAVNEAVVMPEYHYGPNTISKLCNKIGQVELLKEVFDTAWRTNPKAFLILNDFEIWGDRYEKLIEKCLNAGVAINAIGIQSHMHTEVWEKGKTWQYCEKIAKFGKPIHFSEVTVLSGRLKSKDDKDWKTVYTDWFTTEEGERRQAKEATEFYRLLFSHPAVEAITWWNLSDQNAWMGAPAGLLRKDMSPKPAYDALKKLIRKDWWTGPLALKTDNKGQVGFRGFLGHYVIECRNGKGDFSIDGPQSAEKTLSVN